MRDFPRFHTLNSAGIFFRGQKNRFFEQGLVGGKIEGYIEIEISLFFCTKTQGIYFLVARIRSGPAVPIIAHQPHGFGS